MTITCRLIVRVVARHFGLRPGDILSTYKRKILKHPRHTAWKLARAHTGLSFPRIALQMGGRDHATIICGIASLEHAMDGDRDLASRYDQIESDLIAEAGAQVDLDPNEIAQRVLSTALPARLKQEEIVALCRRVDQHDPLLEEPASGTVPLALPTHRRQLSAAANVAKAFQGLQVRRFTPAEQTARKTLETALKALSPLFPKDA